MRAHARMHAVCAESSCMLTPTGEVQRK